MERQVRARKLATRLALALAAIAVVSAAGAASANASGSEAASSAARAGSIVYVKGGKLWVASPDGRVKRRIRHAGRFESPSQADNGTIVAQRGIYLYRMNRRGRLLNKPITTAFRTNRVLPAFKGPFWPQVSPDGTKIAYTYSFTAAYYDPSCMCTRVSPSFNTSYTRANRFTDWPQRVFGTAGFYSKPSWVDNRTVLAATQHIFNYAGDVLESVALDTLGGGTDSYRMWFSECVAGCTDLQTLQLYRLDDPEMTRQRDKVVVVSGELNGPASGSRMFVYRMRGLPPAFPVGPCHITGASGAFSSPSWSPDGRSLAWADRKGIWVGRVGAIDGPTCEISRRLLVAGGSAPDWGPARP